MPAPPDEFAWIERLRPLTRGDPRALNLMDDAAVLPSRPGFDLVISTDAMVEGVHFLAGEAMDIVARRLLRTSLSDLAAKAAEPFGYFLTTAWPARFDDADRDRFIAGLDEDGRTFGVVLLGGDTVATAGPLTVGATVLGWTPCGRMIRRDGARAGDLCVVCGAIGDGWLGLQAARGKVLDPDASLRRRYRLPEPLFGLAPIIRAGANAAADVSDGLLADAMRIAIASGLGLDLDLDRMPLSDAAERWLATQTDRRRARVALATGGDDYAIVLAVDRARAEAFLTEVRAADSIAATMGVFQADNKLITKSGGKMFDVSRTGWVH